jgi:hypothetical protein
MKWTTMMSAYKQFTSTTYNRHNLSIINTKVVGAPQPMFLNATGYAEIFNAVMMPSSSSTSVSNTSIAALTYALTWVHRTYSGSFPDDTGTLITVLENFLTIPLQWTVTAVQRINYTAPLLGDFSMPNDMITTAVGGSSSQRLVIQGWTGWTFIAADTIVLLFVLGSIIWILRQQEPLPQSTGVAEIDTLELAEIIECSESEIGPVLSRLHHRGTSATERQIQLGDLAHKYVKISSFNRTKNLQHWRIALPINRNISKDFGLLASQTKLPLMRSVHEKIFHWVMQKMFLQL